MRARTILRWGVRLLAGTLGLILIGASAVYGLSERRIRQHFAVPNHPLAIPTDSGAVAHGEHLATIRGCVDCHGENLAGHVLIDDPALGRLSGANLTRGRAAGPLTGRDWELAVRHGLRIDGRALLIMPSHEFTGMADNDVADIAAYAATLPPVADTPPNTRAGPVFRALYLAGQVTLLPAERIDHTKAHAARMMPEPTVAYGAYLAAGCTGCHGAGLAGGKIAGAPSDWKPAANITPGGIGHYTEADFVRALRTGKRPDGSPIDSLMPWKLTRKMTDVELQALFAYLQTVPNGSWDSLRRARPPHPASNQAAAVPAVTAAA